MEDAEDAFTIEDLNEFLSAKTYGEQFEILLKHSEKKPKNHRNKEKKEDGKLQCGLRSRRGRDREAI